MSSPGSPWADPAAGTEPVAYAGPPATAPYVTPPPVYGGYAPGWPAAPYWPAYGPPVPQRPRRPGQVVAAAVLAFVQAAVVALSSAYVLLLASTFGVFAAIPDAGTGADDDLYGLVTEVTALSAVQLLSAVLLVVAGVLVLNRRSRAVWTTLLAGFGVQLALAVYWLVRLTSLADLAGFEPTGVLVVGVLFYAAAPAVGLGLLLAGAVRRWAAGGDAAPSAG
ncbi:hypothetical protein ACI798_07065 [Geodermatophilus sp. SYSU D01045]